METTSASLPIDEDILFSNHKGKQTRGVEKRQRKFIQQIEFIRPFLRAEERILLITTGCSPMSLMEQLLTGSTIFYIKRSFFVFTNQRIFHVPTTMGYSFRNSIAQIELSDCANVQVKGHVLVVKYNSKNTEKFYYIASRERKKLKALIGTLAIGGDEGSLTQRTFLCPRCTSRLKKGNESCDPCGLGFKNRAAGRKISILLPGGGYFYTGHPILGLFDALVEVYLLWAIAVSTMAFVEGEPNAIVAVAFYAVLLALEKLMTIYHANHFLDEFLPLEKAIRVRPK